MWSVRRHVIGPFELVVLWVIKIKKILCARSTSRSRDQSTKRRSRSENMLNNKILVCFVKITRCYDYQTWLTHLIEKCTRCAKVCGLFFLDCAFLIDCVFFILSTHKSVNSEKTIMWNV